MIDYLATRGFGYGSGLLSPDCRQFLLNMPKNASSFMLGWGTRQGWTQAIVGDTCGWHLCEELIVVLRDPLDRWVSGIAQYINTYILSVQGPNGPVRDHSLYHDENYHMPADEFLSLYNQTCERIIFDQINRFDDHVWPQCDLFADLLPDRNRKYFYIDKDFVQNVSSYLNWPIYQDLDSNSGDNNQNMYLLQKFFQNRLKARPDLAQRVRQAYAKDYALIQSVVR